MRVRGNPFEVFEEPATFGIVRRFSGYRLVERGRIRLPKLSEERKGRFGVRRALKAVLELVLRGRRACGIVPGTLGIRFLALKKVSVCFQRPFLSELFFERVLEFREFLQVDFRHGGNLGMLGYRVLIRIEREARTASATAIYGSCDVEPDFLSVLFHPSQSRVLEQRAVRILEMDGNSANFEAWKDRIRGFGRGYRNLRSGTTATNETHSYRGDAGGVPNGKGGGVDFKCHVLGLRTRESIQFL